MYSIQMIILVLSLALSSANTNDQVQTELKLIQILFRHGDRSPVMSYPSDPYKDETNWEKYGGFGQLTQVGMRQHFEFGKFLRSRYSSFLDRFYSRENAKIVSTNFDRTLMSAYSLLNGLYKPVDYQVWNNEVNWQPIPVHTTDKSVDTIFYGGNCPRSKQLKKQVERSDEYIKKNQQFQHLFDIVDENSGCKEHSKCAHMNIDDEWRVGDCLFVEKTHGLKLPEWVEPIYDQLLHSLGWGFYFMFRLPEMAKLQSGGVLKDMRNNIELKVNEPDSKDQIRLYSGHDTYVSALTRLLNITSYINQPPYASAVALELHKELDKENYFVQVFLKNNTAKEEIQFRPMTMDGCETLCPLDKFMELTDDLIIHDFQAECKFKDANENPILKAFTDTKSKRFYMNVSIVLLLLGMITTVLIIVAVFKKARAKDYRHIEEEGGLMAFDQEA